MRLIIALRRELKSATIVIPSIQDFQKQIPELQVIATTHDVTRVDVPQDKVAKLQQLASSYYHVEEDIVHSTS